MSETAFNPNKVMPAPRGSIRQKDIWNIHDTIKIGDEISLKVPEGYVSKDSVGRRVKGTVIDKFPHHVLVDLGRYRESFLWTDLLTNRIRKGRGIFETE